MTTAGKAERRALRELEDAREHHAEEANAQRNALQLLASGGAAVVIGIPLAAVVSEWFAGLALLGAGMAMVACAYAATVEPDPKAAARRVKSAERRYEDVLLGDAE